jgi:hypothetical protein
MNAHLGRPLRRTVLLAGLVAALSGLVGPAGLAGTSGPAAPDAGPVAEGAIMDAGHPDAVPNRYIVVFRDKQAEVTGLAARYGATVHFTYRHALDGMAVEADAAQARRLAADPAVAYVAQDRTVTVADDVKNPTADAAYLPTGGTDGAGIDAVQPNPPSWGLDRIDERSRPVDLKYHYPSTASSVKVYIIGTGIRYTHQEFGGRASLGVDTVGDGQNGNDCQGSGTFISGVVGGSTVGVAKAVRLRSVRVLNCAGTGTFSQVIAGVDWITADATATRVPSVANMSIGGGANQPLDDAVTRSIAANVHYSVAAGGSASDACNFSPARVARATTVGATDAADNRASFSGIGPCLDVFAPGVNIHSSWVTADNAYNTISGTTPATSYAAGVAALWRHRFPADNADAVATALAANATPGVVVNPGTGSPNVLLFSGMIPV